jgi:hypothetical protein
VVRRPRELESDVPRGATRRAMLSRAGLLALGAFGLGAASGTAATRATDDEAFETRPARRRTRTVTLFASDVRLASSAIQPGRRPTKTDVAAPLGKLRDRRDRPAGEFHAALLPGSGDALEFHQFRLKDGTILGMGVGGLSGGSFAIVGGTGRFAGATGSYVARRAARSSARSQTEFVLTLTA